MKLEFHPDARDEFVAAAAYYDAAVSGLGDRFLLAVRRATDLLLTHPMVGTPRSENARGVRVTGFPYDVVYPVGADAVQVLAIAHQRRRPGFWKDRGPR